MKVLLISENMCRENLAPYPLGAAYVAAAAGAAGHSVMGLDLMFLDDPVLDVSRSIHDFEPECIGLSIRNIDNQDVYKPEFYLPPVRDIVGTIKSETDAPLVLGGPGFTIFPLKCLAYFGLEIGVVGEGESPFLRLLECLDRGADPDGLPGLAVRRNGKGKVNRKDKYLDLKRAPWPDRDTFDVTPYNWFPGSGTTFAANIEARRGCHMDCIYCPNPVIEGCEVRLRDPLVVADELQSIKESHGIRNVFFTDSLFNYPLDYTMELCRRIASRGLAIQWTCSFNPLFHAPGLLEMMKAAGCFAISLGNESGSADMLAALKKGFSKADIIRNAREARGAGIALNCFLLLGGPGETRKSVEESVDLMDEIVPETVTVTVGIRIYPGCELADIAVREGVISPRQNLLEPTFYLASDVAPWLREYMLEVCKERKGWSF